MRRFPPARAVLLVALLSPLSACMTWRAQQAPPTRVLSPDQPRSVRITRTDQSTLVLRNARLVNDSIVGEAGEARTRTAVAVADVQRLEVRRTDAVRTGGLAVGTGVILFSVLIVAAAVAVLTAW